MAIPPEVVKDPPEDGDKLSVELLIAIDPRRRTDPVVGEVELTTFGKVNVVPIVNEVPI